jgi:hypothetical protein
MAKRLGHWLIWRYTRAPGSNALWGLCMVAVGCAGLTYGDWPTIYYLWLGGGVAFIVLGLIWRKRTGTWRERPRSPSDSWQAPLS